MYVHHINFEWILITAVVNHSALNKVKMINVYGLISHSLGQCQCHCRRR